VVYFYLMHVSFIFMTGFGFFGGGRAPDSKAEQSSDFFVAGKNLRTWFCGGCVAASPKVEGSEPSMAFG